MRSSIIFYLFHFISICVCSAGGLVTAVAPVVIRGNGLWVGWPGLHSTEPLGDIPESDPSDQTPTAGLRSDQVIKELFEIVYKQIILSVAINSNQNSEGIKTRTLQD